MDVTEKKSESSTGALIIDSQPTVPKLYRDPFWFLPFYIQGQDGDTQLHILIVNLPKYDNFTQHLISVTWPQSLLDVRNDDGMAALHLGAMGKHAERVRQLLVAGANPMSKDKIGCIPLHYASMEGNVDMVTTLTKAFNKQEKSIMKSKNLRIPDLSLSLRERNNEGDAPLHLATEFGHLEVVKLLLRLGATLDTIRYSDGRRPLQIAIMQGHKEITQFILKHHEENPNNPLHYQYCYAELIIPLKKMGLDGKFIEICKLPVDSLSPPNSSDSE